MGFFRGVYEVLLMRLCRHGPHPKKMGDTMRDVGNYWYRIGHMDFYHLEDPRSKARIKTHGISAICIFNFLTMRISLWRMSVVSVRFTDE